MLDQIIETIWAQDIFEWIGLLSGIIYVLLAARENPNCWWFGILSCGMIAFKDLTEYRLFADAALQIFYVIVGIWGLFMWFRKNEEVSELQITKWPLKRHLIIVVCGLLCTIPLGLVLNTYTDAVFSYIDTFTTIFSIVATIMLVYKVLENWIYWIILDIVYIFLYSQRGGYLFAFLLLIYTIIAVYGYLNWLKKYRLRTEGEKPE